jgi:aminopeptidase N
MRRVLNQLVYQKGGWTLHMLRARVGTDAFWAGIRKYYRHHRDGLASTDDFRRVMEETAGVDLSGFFDQWLKRPGSPSIEGHWRFDQPGGRVVIDLSQVQAGEPYRLALEFGLSFEATAAPKVETTEMAGRQLHLEIPADKEPTSVILDPNTNVLMQSKLERR